MHWELNLFNFVPLILVDSKWIGDDLIENLERSLSRLFRG